MGASVAISALHLGVAHDLVLFDARGEVAEGETMDLAHGSSFYHSAEVRSGTLDELLETDVLVMCAGRGGRPEQSRLDLLRDNARIAFGIAETFKDYKGSSLS